MRKVTIEPRRPKRSGGSRFGLVTVFGAALALVTTSVCAHAAELPQTDRIVSTRRPFYVQGTFASIGVWNDLSALGGALVYWHPDVEFGWHITGRHDGVVIGIRQGFYVGQEQLRLDVGETLLRGGYDFALPFRNGRFELTLAPFGTFGLNYIFAGPSAGLHWSIGFEAKLFFFRELYLLARPVELSIGEYVNGQLAKNVFFNMNAGVGLGAAF